MVYYSYRKLESCGKTFFRILEKHDVADVWTVVPGTFDYDRETDAQHKVTELGHKVNGSRVSYCGECLMTHVETVPLNSNGQCGCCAADHKLVQS